MENTIIKHISFISLEKATLSYISLNVSKELAFSICAYAVESGEVTASKVLQLWMSKLGTVYNFEDFGEVDWRHLALCCQNYFEGVTHADEESSNIDGVNCKLCCWLKSSYDFLETVQRKAKKVNLSGLCLFLSFILETAQKCCTFFRLNANSEEWKSQNELVNSVHNLSLNLVWGLLESVEEADDVVYCSIIPFINRICLSSMQNTCLDIKTKVEIWKYAAKFALRYESCSHIGSRNDRTESEWPKSAMNLLIFEIKRNLLVIYNKELNEDVQYVEKYLRVTGFYLKILYEMTTVFQHSNFPVANELFDVLLLTISAPDFIKMSNVFTFVKKHILNGIINILPMMCKNGEFKQMVNDHVGESGSFSFELVMSYLHACIANDDIEFLSSNAESLTRILTRTFQDGELFVDGSSFDEIIDIYATLTHLDSTQSLLRKMQQFVLKGNSALSFACTEVLILVSSLNDRVDEVKSHIEFWNQVDDQFTQFSSNCKRLNVERLIINKNMLCMNQRSNSIHQVQICAISKHSLYNHQTLRRITDRNYCIDHETCNRKIVSNLRYLIERFECNEISVEDHYEIVNAMYKLARCRAVIPKDLQQKIEDFVKKIIDAWTRNHKYAFKRVLSAGFVLIATSANEMQFKILTCIKKCLESGVRFSVMGFWIFLRACCKQQKDLDLYKIAQPIIADTEIPDIIRVSMFENNITQCANNRTVDMQHYSHIESLSKCTTCIKPYFPHRKRLRRENDYEDNDVEDLVQNVCRTLKTILPLSKQLKQSEVEKLTNICRDIKTITDSHHNKS